MNRPLPLPGTRIPDGVVPIELQTISTPLMQIVVVSFKIDDQTFMYRCDNHWKSITQMKATIGLHAAYRWFSHDQATEAKLLIDEVLL